MPLISSKLTYEDLQQAPDDDKRYELIEGDLLVSPSPTPVHQTVVGRVFAFLLRLETAGLGRAFVAPLDVVLDTFNVLEPDVLFIATERLSIIGPRNVQGPPDLVVEVLSEGTRQRDLGLKLHTYARFGVRFYWILDAEKQTVQPYQLVGESYEQLPLLPATGTLDSPLFPGISTLVANLFS
ncbi:MAG TPA: Uma2 family endonuclease [Chloroflexota bacterium]|nr:Uma2 family endonuclease [Chloroflexota bacterium]